jgi:hypothetical protein
MDHDESQVATVTLPYAETFTGETHLGVHTRVRCLAMVGVASVVAAMIAGRILGRFVGFTVALGTHTFAAATPPTSTPADGGDLHGYQIAAAALAGTAAVGLAALHFTRGKDCDCSGAGGTPGGKEPLVGDDKQAYRAQNKILHPDKQLGKMAAQKGAAKISGVQEAYETLADKRLRAGYERAD